MNEMRQKQLSALMRIDYSQLRLNKVPTQLVLRRFTKRTLASLRESIKDDALLCQAGELLDARSFLGSVGLDPAYAGEWSNELVCLEERSEFPRRDTLKWKYSEDFKAFLETEGQISKEFEAIQASFQDETDPILNLFLERNEQLQSVTTPRDEPRVNQPPSYRPGLVCLKIGREKAARIGNLGTSEIQTPPQRQMLVENQMLPPRQMPPPTCKPSTEMISQPQPFQPKTGPGSQSSPFTAPHPPSSLERPASKRKRSSLPVTRILGGMRCYQSLDARVADTASGRNAGGIIGGQASKQPSQTTRADARQLTLKRSSPLRNGDDNPIVSVPDQRAWHQDQESPASSRRLALKLPLPYSTKSTKRPGPSIPSTMQPPVPIRLLVPNTDTQKALSYPNLKFRLPYHQ